MPSIPVFLTLATCALSFPAIPTYNQQNAALAYYNPSQYLHDPKLFQEEWEKFWNNLMNQHNALQSQLQWPASAAAPPPGFQGSWAWVQASGHPNVAFGTNGLSSTNALAGTNLNSGVNNLAGANSQSGANALSGTNLNSGVNNLAGANSQSGANALSGTNSNLGIQSTFAGYEQQASQATSGTNTNSGTNIHQGINTHQGTNTGPSNYNGPLSGASSTVNTPGKQPVFIQGAVSNVGNAGSIYVPGN